MPHVMPQITTTGSAPNPRNMDFPPRQWGSTLAIALVRGYEQSYTSARWEWESGAAGISMSHNWYMVNVYNWCWENMGIQKICARNSPKLPTIPNPIWVRTLHFPHRKGESRKPAPPGTDPVSYSIVYISIVMHGDDNWFFFFFFVNLVQPFPLFSLMIVFRVGVRVRVRWRMTRNWSCMRWGEWFAICVCGMENHVCPLFFYILRWVHPIHQPTVMFPVSPATPILWWWHQLV